MIKVVIHGSKGRMGQALLACGARNPDIELVGELDVGDEPAGVIAACEVVIDFSLHHATPEIAELCARKSKALVIGTTGHLEAEKARIRSASASIPIVWAANYSTGVNTLFWLARQATAILGPEFNAEIVEMHHRHKEDAPSGTALRLAEVLAEVRQAKLDDIVKHGRQGILGARTDTEIGVHSLRGGDVVGEHTVIFAGSGERVELTHKASSRDTFANGALRAAQWIVGRKAGIYRMEDVLGLE